MLPSTCAAHYRHSSHSLPVRPLGGIGLSQGAGLGKVVQSNVG